MEDPRRLLEVAKGLLDDLLARYGPVSGIGVTGQMHGILYLDEHGRPVSPLYTWLDARAWRQAAGGRSFHDLMRDVTGCDVPVGFGATIHFANLQLGLVPPEARFVCGLPEYVAMQLAGCRTPVTDPTLAHGLGLFDSQRSAFDTEAWTRLGAPRLQLPEVNRDGRVLGCYQGQVAVCTPLGDNQASFLGSTKDPGHSALVNLGTGGQISCLEELLGEDRSSSVGRATSELQYLERRPYPGGRTLYVGATLTGGKALQVLAQLISEIVQGAGGTCDPYALMAAVPLELAGPVLRVDTRFAGSRTDPDVRGSIHGIGLRNFTLAHLVHGFCQGIVDEFHQLWRSSRADVLARPRLQYLVGSGNALRTNPVLIEHMRVTFEQPVYVPAYREEAAVGAAIHAAALIEQVHPDQLARQLVTYEDPARETR